MDWIIYTFSSAKTQLEPFLPKEWGESARLLNLSSVASAADAQRHIQARLTKFLILDIDFRVSGSSHHAGGCCRCGEPTTPAALRLARISSMAISARSLSRLLLIAATSRYHECCSTSCKWPQLAASSAPILRNGSSLSCTWLSAGTYRCRCTAVAKQDSLWPCSMSLHHPCRGRKPSSTTQTATGRRSSARQGL